MTAKQIQRAPISGSTRGQTQSLPPDLAAAAVRRLRAFAWIVIFGSIVYLAMGAVAAALNGKVPPAQLMATRLVLTGLTVIMSSFVIYLAPTVASTTERLIRLATAYLLAIVLLGALPRSEMIGLLGIGSGWSGVSVAILLFPILIPISPRRALLTGLVATGVEVSAFLLSAAVYERPYENYEVALVFRGDLIASGIAYANAYVVADLRHKLQAARKLGAYELLDCIGRGGMGEVWRAKHGLLARPAAVKLIKAEPLARLGEAGRRVLITRFEREAQSTALLESPHTIDIYDFGVANDGTVYYAMELLRGVDLDDIVREVGPLPPARVVHIMLQACESLSEAHAHGLVHRDIKPSNIFLCRYGGELDFVKVLDFGLVKLLAGAGADTGADAGAKLTGEGVAGTPAFLPPEQAMKEGEVDARSDIYALGCVAYWLLTAKLVFDGRTVAEFLVKHVHDRPVGPSTRAGVNFPPELEALVMACLEKAPEDRPQTIAELARALRATELAHGWTREDAQAWWDAREARVGARSESHAGEAVGETDLLVEETDVPGSAEVLDATEII